MSERGILRWLRFAGSAPRRKHGEDAALCYARSGTKASDEARRRESAMIAAREDAAKYLSERRVTKRQVERCRKCQRRRLFAPTRDGTFSDEAIYAGLRPEDVLVYVERAQGRGNRPYQKDEYRWAKKRRTLDKQATDRQDGIKKWDKGGKPESIG